MLQMSFGIGERDVKFVLEKHWDMVVNPNGLSPAQMAIAALDGMSEEDRDNIANAVMDAYLEDRDEDEAVHTELRKYLIAHRFVVYAPRIMRTSIQADLAHAHRRLPERRQAARHT